MSVFLTKIGIDLKNKNEKLTDIVKEKKIANNFMKHL